MSLTFYFAPQSTASTVHWTLEELGVPHEKILVNLRDDADKKKKLPPVNPNVKVPVLVHDGTPIFESAAIQAYLGETFGVAKGFYPPPGPQRGVALKWLVWANVTLAEAVIRWQRNVKEWVPAAERNAAAGEAAKKELGELIGLFEQELGAKSYILGDAISVPDFHLASIFEWIQHSGMDLKTYPKTSAWLKRCMSRPAYERTQKEDT
jgi:glutathione S-transferase